MIWLAESKTEFISSLLLVSFFFFLSLELGYSQTVLENITDIYAESTFYLLSDFLSCQIQNSWLLFPHRILKFIEHLNCFLLLLITDLLFLDISSASQAE